MTRQPAIDRHSEAPGSSVKKARPMLPSGVAIQQLLAGLFSTHVSLGTSKARLCSDTAACAVYRSSADGAVRIVLLADAAFVAASGAALSLLPVDVANEALRTRQLSPILVENFGEVTSVLVAVLNQLAFGHLRRDECTVAPRTAPAGLCDVVKRARSRLDLDVRVNSYTPGKLSIIAA